jgi:hypothetical protein
LEYGPFYDSASYHLKLFEVMGSASSNPIDFSAVFFGESTVFFPWIVAHIFGVFLEPSRDISVLVQAPLVFILIFAVYRYFLVLGNGPWFSLFLSVPFISFPGMFFFNGGLPDFRMDLSQALAYGGFTAALLTARLTGSIFDWILAGTLMAIAFLTRATSPVYIVPLVMVSFLLELNKGRIISSIHKYSIMTSVGLILSGWFFVLNFEYLYYYYVVWNTDANAKLPWEDSFKHLDLFSRHLGVQVYIALALVVVASSLFFSRRLAFDQKSLLLIAFFSMALPLGYLVISGSGLNPFVSMVAVPGFLLFILTSISLSCRYVTYGRLIVAGIIAVLAPASIATATFDFEKNVDAYIPSRAGLDRLSSEILSGSKSASDPRIISILYLGSLSPSILRNHLLFETKTTVVGRELISPDGIAIKLPNFGFGAKSEWDQNIGTSDIEKVQNILTSTQENSEYIIVPTVDSLVPLHHIVNRYIEYINNAVSRDVNFELILSEVGISKTEKMNVYKRKKP